MIALSYIICTAPRTGSTLLAQALIATGRAGQPQEYFDPHEENEHYWQRALGSSGDADYVDKVMTAGTTSNGVFGLKLFWHQTPTLRAKLLAALGRAADERDASLHALIGAKLGPPRYLWLRRKNKVAQAISYYRASRTGLWRSLDTRGADNDSADRELPFDFPAIDQLVRTVQDFDEKWHEYFQAHRQKVLLIHYEDFIRGHAATVRAIFDFLEIPHANLTVAMPALERQADQRSHEWERRYLEARAGRDVAALPSPP